MDAPISSDYMRQLAAVDDAHCKLARVDGSAFASYVIRDEESGDPIEQTQMHEEWHWLAEHSRRLLLWAHIEAGKTQQMAIARVLYELGRNPNLRVVICSNTHGQAAKICGAIGRYIEGSAELHRVFPDLRRAKGLPWNQAALHVERETKAKDPSVQVLGIHGNILGARIDLLILDDILDYENTLSPNQRDDLWAWYRSTLETRLTRRARVVCIGTAWHREDLMHRLATTHGWRALRYPVVDDSGASSWSRRWPDDRVEFARRTLGPVEFSRQLLCISRSDEDSRFKLEWIDMCRKRGEGKRLLPGLEVVPAGFSVYTGVDLGVRQTHGSALTVLFTIAVHPNEDRQVIGVESGRWAGNDIVERIIDAHNRYRGIAIVEDNAAQRFIVDFTRNRSAVPVRPFTTGKNVSHPEFGLESIAAEMGVGKWIIPTQAGRSDPEVEAWIRELLYYDPKGHPGDRLMASWFAREGARMTKPKGRRGRLDLLSR